MLATTTRAKARVVPRGVVVELSFLSRPSKCSFLTFLCIVFATLQQTLSPLLQPASHVRRLSICCRFQTATCMHLILQAPQFSLSHSQRSLHRFHWYLSIAFNRTINSYPIKHIAEKRSHLLEPPNQLINLPCSSRPSALPLPSA